MTGKWIRFESVNGVSVAVAGLGEAIAGAVGAAGATLIGDRDGHDHPDSAVPTRTSRVGAAEETPRGVGHRLL